MKTNSFKHLHYQKDKYSPFQCDTLIQNALQKPPARIPLYCLYSNWNTFQQLPWKCATYYPVEESYGCSILSAFAVRYLRSIKGRKATHFRNLLSYVSPWHCLVCCRGYGKGDLPSRVFRYWREFILEVEEAIFEELTPSVRRELNGELDGYRQIYNEIELTEEPPSYVRSLLNNELEEQPDPNLRTLTIFKERGEPV